MKTDIEILREALKDCGWYGGDGDTCGVCEKHFPECEDETMSHDDPPFTKDNTFFACAGARARALLENRWGWYKVKPK